MAQDEEIPISHEAATRIGKILVQELVQAAKAEFSRRQWPLKSPSGVDISKSFAFTVTGKGIIEITSTFPGLEDYATGMAIKRDAEGKLIIHHGSLTRGDLWTHPGAGKRNFIYFGLEKGWKAAEEIVLDEAFNYIVGMK